MRLFPGKLDLFSMEGPLLSSLVGDVCHPGSLPPDQAEPPPKLDSHSQTSYPSNPHPTKREGCLSYRYNMAEGQTPPARVVKQKSEQPTYMDTASLASSTGACRQGRVRGNAMKFPVQFPHIPGHSVGDCRWQKSSVAPQLLQTWGLSICSASCHQRPCHPLTDDDSLSHTLQNRLHVGLST